MAPAHDQSALLDRSLLPKLEEVKSPEETAKEGKKVKRLMNPNRFDWLRNLKTFLLIELFAAIVAAGYLATQAPVLTPLKRASVMSATCLPNGRCLRALVNW